MFDLTSSKLLILAVVALVVVGPKDLPALMRTIGRYVGMLRRQANEFRAQFEDAMRDSELADLKKEVEQLGDEARGTLHETTSAVESHISDATREVNDSLAEMDKRAEAVKGEEPEIATEAAAPSLEHQPAEPAPLNDDPLTNDPGAVAETTGTPGSTRSGA